LLIHFYHHVFSYTKKLSSLILIDKLIKLRQNHLGRLSQCLSQAGILSGHSPQLSYANP